MRNYEYTLNYVDLGFSETLSKNPIGWDDLGLTYERNEFYNSVLRTFTLSLRFTKLPGAGGENIEESYNTAGVSANVEINIKEVDPQTGAYESFYVGILDFNPERFSIKKDWVEVGIIDADKLNKFISRDQINYDINSLISSDDVSITPFANTPREIQLKKIDIYRLLESSGNMQDNFYFSVTENPVGNPSGTWYQPGDDPVYIKYYADDVTINELGSSFKSTNGSAYSERSIEVYENEQDGIVNIEIDNAATSNKFVIEVNRFLPDTFESEIFFELVVEIYDSDDVEIFSTIVDSYSHVVDKDAGRLNPYTEDIVLDLSPITGNIYPLSSGDKLRIATKVYTNDISEWQDSNSIEITEVQTDMILDFTEESLGEADSFADSYFPYEAFTRLIQLATSETDTDKLLYSEILGRTDSEFQTYSQDGSASLDAIISAWNIRRFPNKAFNVNIRDLFQTFNSIYSLGLGYDRVNDRFYISPLGTFYDSSYLMFDLGEVDDLVIRPYKEGYFNEINSGYDEKGDYEDLSGVKEYNLVSEHSETPPIKSTLNSRGVYNADSVGIETTRRKQYSESASEDTKNDDKIYIVRTDGTYSLQAGSGVSGFKGIEQYYNIALTPRENLIRNSGLIKPSLYLHDLVVKFVKAQKDINISYTNQNGNSVNEFDDLDGTDLLNPSLFIPETYEFKSKISPELVAILNSNPHGYFTFTFDGNSYQGYLLSLDSGYYDRKANYKLVAKELADGDNYIFEENNNFVFEDGSNYVFN